MQKSSPSTYRITKYRTFDNTITINQNFPDNTYLRVSAHSLFHNPLGFYSNSVAITDINPESTQEKIKTNS